MKLKIEYLAPYLPYKLSGKVICHEYKKEVITFLDTISYFENVLTFNDGVDVYLNNESLSEFKPILRPLSDLNKKHLDYMYFIIISTDNEMFGSRDDFEDYFNETYCNYLPKCLFEYLLEHHFDVFGLIEEGLAIDINTL